MPKTKADCDYEIGHLKAEVEKLKGTIAIAKTQKNPGWQNIVASCQGQISYCKGKIAKLQALKKSLK